MSKSFHVRQSDSNKKKGGDPFPKIRYVQISVSANIPKAFKISVI